VDPSALIFVALAVAWAVYLIPKALEHHEEGVRTRTVERFSATMRVLARREPVSGRKARLVSARSASSGPADRSQTVPDLPNGSLDVKPEPILTPVQERARRKTAARAARRRLRAVSLILAANVVVVALAFGGVLGWRWCAVPVGVLVAWLVACRLMVRKERGITRTRGRRTPRLRIPAEAPDQEPSDNTEEISAVRADSPDDAPVRAAGSWDPVPVTLPTYVSKPLAPRSVSTIDLDSTGVWSSGHHDADSELVREATARQDDAGRTAHRRAVGD
jgi:hypothetical protein